MLNTNRIIKTIIEQFAIAVGFVLIAAGTIQATLYLAGPIVKMLNNLWHWYYGA